MADLLSPEPEPVRWVSEPFLPEGGLALLVAFMKVGKTTFAYALAAALAQGRPFLGFPTKRGGVLLLAPEEHPRDVRLRLKRFGIHPEEPVYVHEGALDAHLVVRQITPSNVRGRKRESVSEGVSRFSLPRW